MNRDRWRAELVEMAEHFGATRTQAIELVRDAERFARAAPPKRPKGALRRAAARLRAGVNRSDTATLVGFGALSYGMWQVYEPAALIGGGALVLLYGIATGVAGEQDLERSGEVRSVDGDPGQD